MATLLRDLVEKYKEYVINNSETIGHVESAARILSYIAPGNSAAVSELLSSLVSLVVLVNDSLLRAAANVKFHLTKLKKIVERKNKCENATPIPEKQIAFCLTIIEHVEVFLEIAALGSGDDKRRWIIVLCIQIIKAALRFLLLYKYKCGILSSPPVPALKRNRELLERLKQRVTPDEENNTERKVSFEDDEPVPSEGETFTLSSSGRKVRTLASNGGASGDDGVYLRPDLGRRKPLPSVLTQLAPTPLDDRQKLGESLHIARPLVHLLSMYISGQSSWKPFFLACGLDITSLCLMGDPASMNVHEKEELKRRTFVMLLYLLRSPFYDTYSRTRLLLVLGFMAHKVPGLRLIIRPLLDYLPIWQKIYFYVWMT